MSVLADYSFDSIRMRRFLRIIYPYYATLSIPDLCP